MRDPKLIFLSVDDDLKNDDRGHDGKPMKLPRVECRPLCPTQPLPSRTDVRLSLACSRLKPRRKDANPARMTAAPIPIVDSTASLSDYKQYYPHDMTAQDAADIARSMEGQGVHHAFFVFSTSQIRYDDRHGCSRPGN
jgi:hypothetical protein